MGIHLSWHDWWRSSSSTGCSFMNNAMIWYIVFGLVHELCHWIVAVVCLGQPWALLDNVFQVSFWYGVLIGRKLTLVGDSTITYDDNNNIYNNNIYNNNTNIEKWISIIQHGGWVASIVLALWVERHVLGQRRRKKNINKAMRWAVWITALEALWTDLLHFPVIPTILGDGVGGDGDVDFHKNDLVVLRCGNFGMILLHHVWWTNEYQSVALDVLEKMIQVTMMRGAQSGGVVCFHPTKDRLKVDDRYLLHGVRTRVLNKKRTDLSVLLRQLVYRDNSLFRKPFPKDFVPVYTGHTRFATSSISTLQGAHPHMWTPSSYRRVYNMSSNPRYDANTTAREPLSVIVENYVTHNGDFDFYRVNGKSYGLELIQKWLVRVLHHPMPSAVDSNAIAGIIDVLRTQGCFGLSARFAVCLDMPTSDISDADSSKQPFPTYHHFESIGLVFENILREMLKSTSLSSIDESSRLREAFAWRAVSELAPRYGELFIGAALAPFVHDGENGTSLFAFCDSTIRAFFDNDLFAATKMFMANAIGSFGICVTSSLDAQRQLCMAARGQTMSVAFYPSKAMILYGSEQAAVKAGLRVSFPGDSNLDVDQSSRDVDKDALRLDLDGECDQSPPPPPCAHSSMKLSKGQLILLLFGFDLLLPYSRRSWWGSHFAGLFEESMGATVSRVAAESTFDPSRTHEWTCHSGRIQGIKGHNTRPSNISSHDSVISQQIHYAIATGFPRFDP